MRHIMVIRMVRPVKRLGTNNAQFRHRIPLELVEKLKGQTFAVDLPLTLDALDERATFRVSCTIGAEIKFSLKTKDPRLISVRHATALGAVATFLDAAKRGPVDLNHRQLQAVLGLAYRQLMAKHEDNPPPMRKDADWSEFEEWKAILIATEECLAFGNSSGLQRAVDTIRPLFEVDLFLASNAMQLTEKSYKDFVKALPETVADAMGTLIDRARGNYKPDQVAAKFPEWNMGRPEAHTVRLKGRVETFDDLFDRWKAESKRAASTISTWRGYINRFKTFVGHDDPHRVERVDAQRWKDALVNEGRKKVSSTYLATFNTLYRFGMGNSETTGIRHNPFDGVKAKQKVLAGTKRLPFATAEVATILNAARGASLNHLRWIPWLQAQTGARVAEVAQLWGAMIEEDDHGHPCIHFLPAPDGGSLKNEGSERVVPLHPHIISAGFMDFVRSRGSGPLFYGARQGKIAIKTRDEQKHPSKGVSNRLGVWVRNLGITDERKAPTHSFRHWFKSEMMRLEVSDKLVDKIQGHSDKNDSSGYVHADTSMMLAAISKLDLNAIADSARKRA